jgi:hypothetical protein
MFINSIFTKIQKSNFLILYPKVSLWGLMLLVVESGGALRLKLPIIVN